MEHMHQTLPQIEAIKQKKKKAERQREKKKKTKREKEKHFAKALYHSTPLHVLHYKVFLNSFRNTTI